MHKIILLSLCAAIALRADVAGSYIHYQSAALSSSALKLTVQQIASGTRDLRFVSATIWCSVDATVTLRRDGTAASATVATPVRINGWQQAATATAYTSSNVGTGTVIRAYDWKGGSSEMVIDLSRFVIPRTAGTGGNLTIETNAITGDCKASIVWDEWR